MTEHTEVTDFNTKIKNCIKEVVNHQTVLNSYKEKIKDVRDQAKELGMETKLFNKLVRMYAKDERDQVEAESQEIIDKYDEIFKGIQ